MHLSKSPGLHTELRFKLVGIASFRLFERACGASALDPQIEDEALVASGDCGGGTITVGLDWA